jgi:hypothetical protein
MRAIRRVFRRWRAERRVAPRREAAREALATHLGHAVALVPTGAAGRDSIYRVERDGEPVAMLRLANPHKRRRAPEPCMPYVWLPDEERLGREWDTYGAGAASGLTPAPLWRGADAIACAHVAGERMSDALFREPATFWSLNARAARGLAALHALGVTHMDACLANLLAHGQTLTFIDFEYAPAPGLAPAQQRAYDHLRLVESGIKFMPEAASDRIEAWLSVLIDCLDADTREADITPLAPALGRLLARADYRAPLNRVFTRLPGATRA